MDRSTYPTSLTSLADAPPASVDHLTPAERLESVWELTAQAWLFKDPEALESRFRRDVVRVARGRR